MPEVPNMAGRVLTVKGPIDPDEIGLTLMHEHLLFEGLGSRSFAPKHDTPASKAAEWYEPMTLKNLYRVRADERSRLDNCKLTDVEMSIAEVSDFRDWGGSTIVDVTNHGIRSAMAQIKRNICCGEKSKMSHSPCCFGTIRGVWGSFEGDSGE